MPPHAFPRRVCAGDPGAWFPYERGETRPIERARFEGRPSLIGICSGIAQEAWPGMTLPQISGGEQVLIEGMRPDFRPLAFSLSAPPEIVVTEKGKPREVLVRAETLLIEPSADRYSIVFGAEATLLKRYLPYAANVNDIGIRIAGGPVLRLPIDPAPNFSGAKT